MISGKLAELYVDLVTRNQLAPAIATAKTQIANVQAQLSALGTPQGRSDAREYVASQEKLAASQKALQREFNVAAYGKFGATMKELKTAVGGFREGLEKLSGGGFGVLGPIIGGLGVMSAIAAASPDHFATLTGSVNYLAGSIGQLLLPVVVDICRWLQDAARWVQSLDAATVANIVTASKWAVGFIAVAGAIKLVSLALASMMAINPWLLGLAGLASLAALGGLFGEGIRDSMRETLGADSLLGAAGPGARRGGALSFEGVAALPGVGSRVGEAVGTGVAGEGAGATVGGGVGSALLTSNPAYWMTLAGSAMVSAVGTAFGEVGRRMGGGEASSRSGSLAGAMTGATTSRGDPLLTARNFQSQFFSIEEQWKRIQQAGASLSPLDSEMLRIHTDNRMYLASIAGSTAHIAGRPEPATGMGP